MEAQTSSSRSPKINVIRNQEKKPIDLKNEETGQKEMIKTENVSYKDKSEISGQDRSFKRSRD